MMERYIMVTWPDIQRYMEDERWEDCIMCQDSIGHNCPDCAYMVPEDLYFKYDH